MSKLRILCDVDGVLADFTGLVLDYVAKNVGLIYLRTAIDDWDHFGCIGLADHWPYFRTQVDELGLCRTMRELPGAREFYAGLRQIVGEGGDVRVCTTPMTTAWLTQRAEWLEAFGVPLKEQIQWCDKHELVPAYDVLIDDKVENCTAFAEAGGVAFCIATPYNTELAGSTRIPRGSHSDCLQWLRGLAGERSESKAPTECAGCGLTYDQEPTVSACCDGVVRCNDCAFKSTRGLR